MTFALSLSEAFERIRKDEPDCLIVDAANPNSDGYALVRQLRATSISTNIPIWVLIPNDSDDEVAKARSAGADNWLTPIKVGELLRALGR